MSTAPSHLHVEVKADDDCVRIAVAGDIDMGTVGTLGNALSLAIKERAVCVEVDMSGVHFIDSAGLRVLVQARNQVSEYADETVHFSITHVSPNVRRVFEVTGMEAFFRLQSD